MTSSVTSSATKIFEFSSERPKGRQRFQGYQGVSNTVNKLTRVPTYNTGNQYKLYQGLYTGRGLEVRGCASVRQSPVLPLPSGVWEAIDLWYHFVSTCQLDTHHLYYRRHPAYQQEELCTPSLLHCYQQEELCTLSISFYTKATAYTKGKRHKALRATLGTPLVLGKGNYNGIQP